MKYTFAALVFISPWLPGFACNRETPTPAISIAEKDKDENGFTMNTKIRIKVGNHTFTATLFNNPTGNAFVAILPLTVNMTELNGNEKYYRLSQNLPTNASNPGTINTGDMMLWGSNTVVLFYKTFSTSYRYTRLGKIDDADGLARALGSGGVTVTFEIP